jgi:hypothetical protein
MNLTWQQAHNISTVRYLSLHGVFPVYSSSGGQEYHYHSPIRSGDNTPSFHLNVVKNKWHDKGMGIGGDIIDLVAEHKSMTRSEACRWLGQSGLYSGDYVAEFPALQKGRYYSTKSKHRIDTSVKPVNVNREFAKLESDTSFMIENIQALQHPVLLQYLAYRCIDNAIAIQYGLQEINYQLFNLPESHYFALAWLNDSGGCEFNSRSGQKSFKGCLGIKDITSINLQAHKKIAVFESAMDFWAYLSYYGIREFQNSAIILNSLSLRNKILEAIEQYQPTELYLFLDNDIEGCKTTESLMTDIQSTTIHDKSSLYVDYKDFNEMVIAKSATADRKTTT